MSLENTKTEIEAALAYDRAMLIVYGDDLDPGELNFPPGDSEGVVFPPETLRQLHALRDDRGLLA